MTNAPEIRNSIRTKKRMGTTTPRKAAPNASRLPNRRNFLRRGGGLAASAGEGVGVSREAPDSGVRQSSGALVAGLPSKRPAGLAPSRVPAVGESFGSGVSEALPKNRRNRPP